MPKASYLDKTFHIIIERFITSGKAPNHKEIADELGVSVREGRKALRKLFSPLGFPGWFEPKTDTIASFAPFSNLSNNHKLTIENEQKWYGQWAFESLAVCWLFPGKTIQIDTICLDCNDPIRVMVKDGMIKYADPAGVIGHVSVPFGKWMLNVPYSWSTMNFFRSEEHLRNWDGFEEEKIGGIIALNDLMDLFSGPFFTKRREPNYHSNMKKYTLDFVETSQSIANAGSYWRLKWFEKLGFSVAMKLGLI